MKILLKIVASICLIIMVSFKSFSQQKMNVRCHKFTLNNKPYNKGESMRDLFEIALSKSGLPIGSVNRELSQLTNDINEEINVKGVPIGKMASANYSVKGNFMPSLINDTLVLKIDFIKISEDDITSTKSISVNIKEEDLDNKPLCHRKFEEKLSKFSFVEGIGLMEKKDSKIVDDKDEKIKELESNFDLLNNKEEYRDMASLTFLGCQTPGSMCSTNELYNTMTKIYKSDSENKIFKFDFNKETEDLADEITRKYPRFPFAYHVKALLLKNKNDLSWDIYERKAYRIFSITTSINGHDESHDQVLKQIKQYLGIK
jgi:hypothetical protein